MISSKSIFVSVSLIFIDIWTVLKRSLGQFSMFNLFWTSFLPWDWCRSIHASQVIQSEDNHPKWSATHNLTCCFQWVQGASTQVRFPRWLWLSHPRCNLHPSIDSVFDSLSVFLAGGNSAQLYQYLSQRLPYWKG